ESVYFETVYKHDLVFEIMDRSNALLLTQLVRTLKSAVLKLEEAYNARDMTRLEEIKKEILALQRRIASIA
ncbi:MAG: hypothetical protein AABY02_00940, partial [Nanoarchaeota archaeon]